MTKYDSTDIFFITIISIYLITLVLFLTVLIFKELKKSKPIKKTTLPSKSNLLLNKHYKHNISYLKNN